MFAPIALFVYARPEHTRLTFDALAANDLACQSDVIVFADAARGNHDIDAVQRTRSIVRQQTAFRSVRLVERPKNIGLACNLIDGISSVCAEYGRVIVLEDDIITGPYFLRFMNDALDRYQSDQSVWHINGWNYPMDTVGLPDAYFWRVMHCWGWATWQDRWVSFSRDPERLIENWTKHDIYRFNMDGAQNFWHQVQANSRGTMNTWAVFWYATIFERNGLCLSPSRSLTQNTGLDGTGSNCANMGAFKGDVSAATSLVMPEVNAENSLAIARARQYCASLERSFASRLISSLWKRAFEKKGGR